MATAEPQLVELTSGLVFSVRTFVKTFVAAVFFIALGIGFLSVQNSSADNEIGAGSGEANDIQGTEISDAENSTDDSITHIGATSTARFNAGVIVLVLGVLQVLVSLYLSLIDGRQLKRGKEKLASAKRIEPS